MEHLRSRCVRARVQLCDAYVTGADFRWLNSSATRNASSEIDLFFEIRRVQQLRISDGRRAEVQVYATARRRGHRAGGLELVASVRYVARTRLLQKRACLLRAAPCAQDASATSSRLTHFIDAECTAACVAAQNNQHTAERHLQAHQCRTDIRLLRKNATKSELGDANRTLPLCVQQTPSTRITNGRHHGHPKRRSPARDAAASAASASTPGRTRR